MRFAIVLFIVASSLFPGAPATAADGCASETQAASGVFTTSLVCASETGVESEDIQSASNSGATYSLQPVCMHSDGITDSTAF